MSNEYFCIIASWISTSVFSDTEPNGVCMLLSVLSEDRASGAGVFWVFAVVSFSVSERLRFCCDVYEER